MLDSVVKTGNNEVFIIDNLRFSFCRLQHFKDEDNL